MPKLKALQVRQAKSPCKLSDGKGLYFEITQSGSKRWIYRYKIAGMESTFTIGHYPDLSLDQARAAHSEAYKVVKQGINPSQERRKEKLAHIKEAEAEKHSRVNTFEYVALEWINQQRGAWSRVLTQRM